MGMPIFFSAFIRRTIEKVRPASVCNIKGIFLGKFFQLNPPSIAPDFFSPVPDCHFGFLRLFAASNAPSSARSTLLGEAGRHRADSQKPELLTMTKRYDDSSVSANSPAEAAGRMVRVVSHMLM